MGSPASQTASSPTRRFIDALRDAAAAAAGKGEHIGRVYELREVLGEDGSARWLVTVKDREDLDRVAARAAAWLLTARERDVLVRVADGLSNKQIAAALRIAEVTAENHLTRIFRKAGVTTRAGLLARLLRDE